MSPARVLLVLPLAGGSLPVGRSCARALGELGHTVEVFEAPLFHGAFEALKGLRVAPERLASLENGFLQLVSQAVLAKAEHFHPDLVLCLAQAPLSRQALKRLRKDNVPTAMWFVEDHRVFTYWRAFAPHYDFFAVIQEEPFLTRLEEIGVEAALYLPLAADPAVHRPIELSAAEKRLWGADVSFLGAGYPNRRRAFKRLLGLDFRIWGTEWEGDAALAPRVQLGGRRIATEEAVKIFNATRVNLNLHSSVRADELVPKGDFVNPRTFELAACGAFQLVDERGLLGDLFEPGELATFETIDELEELIRHFLARPEERLAVAGRARERVLADHTYVRRMRTLLDFVAARRPGWPHRTREEEFWKGYPPELKEKVQAVLTRLKLPDDVAFDDLVWRLRQESGALDATETAILFLDEWRKQYGRK
jgi:spore maturation protein CgeB